MIQDFSVSNYFSIREEQSISFVPGGEQDMLEQYTYEVCPGVRLLKLGIVYGANASGKSTLLQAMDYFREIMITRPNTKAEGMNYLPFMLDADSRNDKSKMQMTFYIEGDRYIINIVFDRERIYQEQLIVYTSVRPTLLYKRSYDAENDCSKVVFGSKLGLPKNNQIAIEGNTTNNCTVIAAFDQSNVKTTRLNKVFQFFALGIKDLLSPKMEMIEFVKDAMMKDTENELKGFLLQVMKASDFNIVDMELEEREETITPEMETVLKAAPIPEDTKTEMLTRGTITRNSIMFKHSGDGGEYDLNEFVESQGTKRFLGMSVLLYKLIESNCMIPIDEIETSVHYELLSYFVKLFLANSEGNSQLLMTTHDINLLNEDFIRRDVVWFTDKDQCGATSVKRLAGLGLHKTLSPYNAYRQGKLVKLPFLGSIYLNKK